MRQGQEYELMKITFVMDGGFGLSGGERVIATYAQQLQNRGHEVFVISRAAQPSNLRQQLRSALKGRTTRAVLQKRSSHFDSTTIPQTLVDHRRSVVDADVPDADVVIATWWETAEWVANLSANKGCKVHFVQHHEVFDYLPRKRVEANYRLPLPKITVAQWLADVMRTRYDAACVSIVPNGVDIHQFHAAPRGRQSIPTVGLMYSTLPWKGGDVSLAAFSMAAQRLPTLRLLAFGDAPPTRELPLPAHAQYVLAPPQSALRHLYAQCDAWLFGSRFEGFGLPMLEAMACRTPVIGTPTGAALDLLADGAGILVNLEDAEAMARAIEQIYHMPETEWRQMSEAAYTKATRYTWSDATQRFEAALQSAIAWQQYCRKNQGDTRRLAKQTLTLRP